MYLGKSKDKPRITTTLLLQQNFTEAYITTTQNFRSTSKNPSFISNARSPKIFEKCAGDKKWQRGRGNTKSPADLRHSEMSEE
jgi:hypothetical protein